MILDSKDPRTGLPQVRETRATQKDRRRVLPNWLHKELATGHWTPDYLAWQDNVLSRLRCWKCGTDLCGWKPVIDGHGNLVREGGRQDGPLCLWFREHNHSARSTVRLRWGCLKREAVFSALHCRDCRIEQADLPMTLAIFLYGHELVRQRAAEINVVQPFDPDQWATYLYRWSNDPAILCEPKYVTVEKQTGQEAMTTNAIQLPTAGKPMLPSDYLFWAEMVQSSALCAGMIVEFAGDQPPPGWTHGPRPGTIQKL